jgi:hypothetical protein
MKSIAIKLVQNFVLGALLLFIISANVYPAIIINGAGGVYGDGEKESTGRGETIENLTAIGAGYFLNGYSDILIFLNRVELSSINGINYDDLNMIIDRALLNIGNAQKSYIDLVKIAESSTYNDLSIMKLREFDYNGYMVENNLNEIIFKEVEWYLKRGDVTGMLKDHYEKVSSIAAMIRSVKEIISMNRFPDISILWRLNQEFSTTLLFGQYAAEVFKKAID